MKIWVGVTDKNWYEHLIRLAPEEVNFWQPSGSRNFRLVQAGEPFLFKLHSPENFIVGGAFFVRYSAMPASLAWDAFERKNGVDSLNDLILRVRPYRVDDRSVDPVIGCNVLAEPFFFSRSQWIPVPSTWAANIVQGKTYESASEEGRKPWGAVQERMALSQRVQDATFPQPVESDRRFGAEYLARGRLGQGAFRVLVTDAYERRCAVTGERTLPVLEAAHIKPYALEGPHSVKNGTIGSAQVVRSGLRDHYADAEIRSEPATERGMGERMRILRVRREGAYVPADRRRKLSERGVSAMAQRKHVQWLSKRQLGTDEVALTRLRDRLRDFASARDWNQFHSPKNLAIRTQR